MAESFVNLTKNLSSFNQRDKTVQLSYLDDVLSAIHLVCGAIGIPLNLMVATVIIRYRRMHKPRNFCWLGVTFSNLFILTAHLIELYAVRYQNWTACLIYISIIGVPYASLLVNLLLSLIDRYLAITCPMWHRVNVRTGRIVKLQVAALVVLWTGVKMPYLSHLIPLQCRLQSLDGLFIAGASTSLFSLCFIGQLVVYFKTKKCLASELADRCNGIPLTELSGNDSTSQHRSRLPRDYFVHADRGNISKMELEATSSVLRGMLSLSIFAIPVMITNGILSDCLTDMNHWERDCESKIWILSCMRVLLLLHSVYNPCNYIVKSTDFKTIVRAILIKL